MDLDWLALPAVNGSPIAIDELILRLSLALVLGGVVASIYYLTQRKTRSELIPFVTTLVLLTILIAMVTIIIGNNTARAFSLVGALAIIRFRTVVEDTRDTAFVIFAVVVGMGTGAGPEFITIPLVGIPILGVATLVLSRFEKPVQMPRGESSLTIRLGIGRDPHVVLQDVFTKYLAHVRLKVATTARQGAAIDLTHIVRLQKDDSALAFVNELNQIEGVQNVELRQ